MTWIERTCDDRAGWTEREECPACGSTMNFVKEGSWYSGMTDEYKCPKCGAEVSHRFYVEYVETTWRGDLDDELISALEADEAAKAARLAAELEDETL